MKSNLQVFSERVAYATYDASPDNNKAIDIMVILGLIEVIAPIVIELIGNCQNKSALKSSVQKPTWLQKVKFRAQVKSALDASGESKYRFLSGKVATAFLAEATKLTDEDMNKILEETEIDNNLI